ncbi:hypothetical protein NQ318_017222 [Aromia moschata]|uniref:Uncharacterized protein n=1 Tax=Aromia moschata TaxID=1265417 RepID=A0AAV8YKQ1_9CUCU|nr:hypothetical protein NQ318_017222 [Aromia moschata]
MSGIEWKVTVTAMHTRDYLLIYSLISLISAKELNGFDILKQVFDECAPTSEIFKCLKIQLIKFADQVSRSKRLSVLDGDNLTRSARSSKSAYLDLNLNETNLQKLDSEELSQLLRDTSARTPLYDKRKVLTKNSSKSKGVDSNH